MIKIATGFYLSEQHIVFIGLNDTVGIKNRIKELKKAGRFLDLSRNKKIKSIILYEQNNYEYGIASPLSAETLMAKMEDPVKGKVLVDEEE